MSVLSRRAASILAPRARETHPHGLLDALVTAGLGCASLTPGTTGREDGPTTPKHPAA